jgi:hypothetical protein
MTLEFFIDPKTKTRTEIEPKTALSNANEDLQLEGTFTLTPTLGIYETSYPVSDDEFGGGRGYCFCFSDGRVFEIVLTRYPIRIVIKRWCRMEEEEFIQSMVYAYKWLSFK